MAHTEKVANYNGENLGQLARDIGNLRYDKLVEFLDELSKEYFRQSEHDSSLNHPKLARELNNLANKICETVPVAEKTWNICEPYMRKKDNLPEKTQK